MAAPSAARPLAETTMLDLVRTSGRLSRVELSALSGHTAPSVTKVIRALIEEGLVREAGLEHQSRGTPRRLLELVQDAWYAVGVQVDRTSSTVVIVDFTGRQVASTGLRGSGNDAPQNTVESIADHVSSLLTSVDVPSDRVLGVGLVTHGPQDRERGMLLTAQPTPAWLGFPLTEVLSDRLGLPALLENDATAAAIGEQWAGAVPIDTFGMLYMATGVGGAVVVDSEPYRGRASNGVEIGHVSLDRGSRRCVCGSRGCVQAVAGPVAVVEAAMRAGLAARLGLRGVAEETLADFERLARASRAGDLEARTLLEDSADCLGAAAVTLADLFDLDTFVLAGPAFNTAAPLYRDHVEAALRTESLSRDLVSAQVLISSNVSTAAALGGALHVLRTMPPRPVRPAPTTDEPHATTTTTGTP